MLSYNPRLFVAPIAQTKASTMTVDLAHAEIALPPPETAGGKPLMTAIKERRSSRAFADRPLSPQTLSNLLWATSGISDPEGGRLTVPNARSRHEVDVFVVTAAGTYRYDIQRHALSVVTTADIRALAGKQDFVATAPVNLVYVVDYARMPDLTPEQQLVYGSTDVGFSVQNAYLYCASAGLATVVRGSVDREALGRALGLDAQQRIILAQCVGWPAAAS